MSTSSIKASARSGVLWGGASQAVGLGLQLLQSIVAARILGPGKYAEIAVIYVISAIAIPLAQSGLGISIIYLQERDPKKIAQVQGLSTAVSAAVSILFFLSAGPVASYFHLEGARLLVEVTAVTVFCSGITSVWMSQLKRDLVFRDIEIAYIGSYVVGFAATISCLLAGWGAVSVALGQAVTALLNAVFLRWALARRDIACGIALPGPGILAHMKTGGINTFSALLAIVSERIDALLIGGRLSAEAFGTYGLFSRTMTALSTPIQRIKLSVELPSYARLMGDRERLRNAFAKTLGVSSLVVCPLFLGLACISDLALRVSLGAQWQGFADVFSVICVLGLLRIVSSATTPLFMAAGMVRRALVIVFARLALLPPLVMIALHHDPSIMSVALVVTASQAVQAAGNYFLFVRPVLGPCAGTLGNAVGRPLAAALIMVAGVLGVRQLLPPGAPDLAQLAICVSTGAVLYAAATAALNRSGLRMCAYMISPLLAAIPGGWRLGRKAS